MRQKGPERHDAPLLEQEHLEQRRAVERDDRGDERHDAELGKAAGERRELADEIVLEVGGLYEHAGNDARKERRGDAEQTRTLLVRDGGLALEAPANGIDVAETHVDLRDRDSHPSSPFSGKGPRSARPLSNDGSCSAAGTAMDRGDARRTEPVAVPRTP